jgi:UDP-N-acetylmuramate dehydrogenase
VALAPLITYRFGGTAAGYAEPGSEDELAEVVTAAAELGVEPIVLGRGSNVVVSDHGVEGLVVRLGGEFGGITVADDGVATAGSAVPLPKLARHTVDLDRGGLEFFVGIPGSVGGAVRMNAGCFGTETAERMIDARTLTVGGGLAVRTPGDLAMTYRSTAVGPADIVLGARFATVDQPAVTGRLRLREITRWRRDHQPGGTLNAGSVFKNPPGDTAGRLIDELGLKGYRIGGASVSTRHANFFEAGEQATAQDVHDLVDAVRRRVADATGVVLEPEIAFLGRFAPATADTDPAGDR